MAKAVKIVAFGVAAGLVLDVAFAWVFLEIVDGGQEFPY